MTSSPSSNDASARKWFIEAGGERIGPMTLSELRKRVEISRRTPGAKISAEGMSFEQILKIPEAREILELLSDRSTGSAEVDAQLEDPDDLEPTMVAGSDRDPAEEEETDVENEFHPETDSDFQNEETIVDVRKSAPAPHSPQDEETVLMRPKNQEITPTEMEDVPSLSQEMLNRDSHKQDIGHAKNSRLVDIAMSRSSMTVSGHEVPENLREVSKRSLRMGAVAVLVSSIVIVGGYFVFESVKYLMTAKPAIIQTASTTSSQSAEKIEKNWVTAYSKFASEFPKLLKPFRASTFISDDAWKNFLQSCNQINVIGRRLGDFNLRLVQNIPTRILDSYSKKMKNEVSEKFAVTPILLQDYQYPLRVHTLNSAEGEALGTNFASNAEFADAALISVRKFESQGGFWIKKTDGLRPPVTMFPMPIPGAVPGGTVDVLIGWLVVEMNWELFLPKEVSESLWRVEIYDGTLLEPSSRVFSNPLAQKNPLHPQKLSPSGTIRTFDWLGHKIAVVVDRI